MDTLLFLVFCGAVIYVVLWVVMNERYSYKDGEWGFMQIRRPSRTWGMMAWLRRNKLN